MKKTIGFVGVALFGVMAAGAGCLSATTTSPDSGTNSNPDGSNQNPDGSIAPDASGPDAGPATIGTPCVPRTGFGPDAGGSDPCPAVGLACDVPPGGTGTCQIPTTGQPCLPSVGCTANDICAPGPRGNTVCATTCTTTTSCNPLNETCQASDAGEACLANPCTDVFGTCNAAGTNDGTCLPAGRGGAGDCYQSGTAPLTGPCVDSRSGGATAICPFGTFCVPDGVTGVSGCLPVCSANATGDAGGACSASDVCVSVAIIEALRPSPDGGGGGIGGRGGASVCIATCPTTDAGPGTCPTGQVCVTTPLGGSYCIP